MAFGRSAGGNSGSRRASDVGMSAAAPTAWSARAATSTARVGAAAQIAEAPTKSSSPPRKARLWPRMSAMRPNGTSSAAKTIA